MGNDSLGRITNYEGTGQTMNASFPAHAMSLCDRFAIKNSGYTYDLSTTIKKGR
ncbi:MAG: hypothetical protein R3C14_42210 [Caldilineaceae bacterium]